MGSPSGACWAFYTPIRCAAGGTVAPDFVGNIRVDQAWGLFQFSAAAHAGYFEGSNLISSAVTPGVDSARLGSSTCSAATAFLRAIWSFGLPRVTPAAPWRQ
jgi:hypothetical protein